MERVTVDGDETTALRPTGEIRCGWCNAPTASKGPCRACGRDARVPWQQRGAEPPAYDARAEADREHSQQLAAARRTLQDAGVKVTNAALAEQLGVDERTVRRWMSAK